MKKPISLFFLLSCIVMLNYAGCGSKEVNISESAPRQKGVTEEIDPFTLGDEFAVITISPEQITKDEPSKIIKKEKQPSVEEEVAIPEENSIYFDSNDTETVDPDIVTMGFRVQIGFFGNEAEAQNFARKAREKVDEKVYIVYEAPFFRVRVGDFKTEKEAEDYVKYLKTKGYKSLLWIRTPINTQ